MESSNQKQLFTLLPAAKPRWKSFLIGWGVQALSLACLLVIGVRVRHDFIPSEHYQVTNLISYEPLVLPRQAPASAPILRSRAPQTSKVAVKSEPALKETSAPATIVLTSNRTSTAERKKPQAIPAAPELKFESKMPSIPNAPASQVVGLGTFPGNPPATTAKPLLAVQVGGFGVSNGAPASGQRGVPVATPTGSFDVAVGSAHGTRIGTSPSVVAQAGFSSPVVPSAMKSATLSKPSIAASTPVEITFKPKPDYTEEGRKQQINGEVRLQVLFSAAGRVRVLRVVEGLGHGLDEQAVKAAEQIKFKPALQEGQPVDSTAVVHIIFELVS